MAAYLRYEGPVTIEPCPICGLNVTNFEIRSLDEDDFSFMADLQRFRGSEIALIPCGHLVRNVKVNTVEGSVAWNEF